MKLTPQQHKFCWEYIKRGNKLDAYKSAYFREDRTNNVSDMTLLQSANSLFNKPDIQIRIAELRALMDADAVYDALAVMRDWVDIATADPNKIIQHRRICCRYCHGNGHNYQWRDDLELAQAKAEMIDTNARRARMKPPATPLPLPSDEGGYGFAFNAKPHPSCPRCLGEGQSNVLLMDTTQLGPKELKLYKGVKIGKDGRVEVLMHDQMAARESIAKAFGMFVERFKPVDPGAPETVPALPLDPTEASRMYAQFIKGDG